MNIAKIALCVAVLLMGTSSAPVSPVSAPVVQQPSASVRGSYYAMAMATINFLKNKEGRSNDKIGMLAQDTLHEVSASMLNIQKMLDRMNKGQRCLHLGKAAYETSIKKWTREVAHDKHRRRKHDKSEKLKSASEARDDARKSQDDAVQKCRCRVKHELSLAWKMANKNDSINARAWKKAKSIMCILDSIPEARCDTTWRRTLSKPRLSSAVRSARPCGWGKPLRTKKHIVAAFK